MIDLLFGRYGVGVGVLSGVSFCYWEVGMVMVLYGGFVWRVIMEYGMDGGCV